MKQIYFRVIACTLSVILLYPAFAVSQTNTGSLSGIVIDVLGIAIPRTKVWATRRSDQGARFETTTGDSGTFSFANLAPGVYEVTVVREDTGSAIKQIVTVTSGRMAQMEVRFSGCDNVPGGKDDVSDVSDRDKAEVLRATLVQGGRQWGLVDQQQRETGVILSTKNIKRDWLQGFQDLRIQLWTPERIQRKADDEGAFQFLLVPEIKVRRQCVVVSLSNTWAKGKRSKSSDMSGGALIYEYRKEFGKWVGKVVASGIS